MSYRIEKRVANTDHWGVVETTIATRDEAIAAAHAVVGGQATGVAIVENDDPYAAREIIIGC